MTPRALAETPGDRVVRLTAADLEGLDDRQAAERVFAVHQANILAARSSSAAFTEFAFTNENPGPQLGQPLKNADFHREWHDFFDREKRAVLLASVEHGKSIQTAGLLLHRLGKNPEGRFAVISATSGMAEKSLQAIRAHIERNPRVQEVFPGLRKSEHEEAPWTATKIQVHRDSIAKDPSIQALGAFGPLVGSRLDGALLDDVLNFENTRTPEQCAKLIEWIDTTVVTRIVDGGWIAFIGTPWNLLDALGEFRKRKGWASRVYAAVKNPDDAPDKWVPTWAEQWPLPRLIERMEGTPVLTFARKYLCRITSDEAARFKMEWIAKALAAGRGRTMLTRRPISLGRRLPCFTGVDLGTSPRKRKPSFLGSAQGSGLTVLFTIAVDERARRVLLEIQAGRWTAPEILTRIGGVFDRFESQIVVEDNGAQSFLVQFAEGRGIPVIPFTTGGQNKHDEVYGVESLAVEMRAGLWVYPSGVDGETIDPEVRALIGELTTYHPAAHTGDRLMAKWFAREAARSLIAEITRHMPTQER